MSGAEGTSEYMQRALELARAALGTTSPNPTVGAVIVAGGEIVGEGATQPPPGPHAEVVALEQAGERARGATMYVTLEPCPHQGRTPPCTGAIIEAGVAEVRYAMADPDPLVDGGGHRKLEEAGVRVHAGEGEAEARRINEAFIKHRTRGLPFVIAKFAASLDGRIAAGFRRLALGLRPRDPRVVARAAHADRRDPRRLLHRRHRRPAADGAARRTWTRSASPCASSSIAAAARCRWPAS